MYGRICGLLRHLSLIWSIVYIFSDICTSKQTWNPSSICHHVASCISFMRCTMCYLRKKYTLSDSFVKTLTHVPLKQSILTSSTTSVCHSASLAGIRSTLISFGDMKRCRVLKVHFYFHCRGSHPPVVVALLTQAVTSYHETAANVLYRIYINTLRPHLNLHLEF